MSEWLTFTGVSDSLERSVRRNLRDDHNRKIADDIVHKYPSTIVVEDLDIKSMKCKSKTNTEQTKIIHKNISQSLQKNVIYKIF